HPGRAAARASHAPAGVLAHLWRRRRSADWYRRASWKIALRSPFVVQYREQRRDIGDIQGRPARQHWQLRRGMAAISRGTTADQPVHRCTKGFARAPSLAFNNRGDVVIECQSGAHDVATVTSGASPGPAWHPCTMARPSVGRADENLMVL